MISLGLINRRHCSSPRAGFSLLELLLASGLGLVVVVIVMNSLFGEGALGVRLSRGMRERQALGRANALIRADLERGNAVAIDPEASGMNLSCGLAGRKAVLQISNPDGKLTTYSVGKSSEPIWRGWVLMRCGRAFRSDGSINGAAAFQNRVVIDGLDPAPGSWSGCDLPQAVAIGATASLPLAACMEPISGTVQWQLRQRFDTQRLKADASAVLSE